MKKVLVCGGTSGFIGQNIYKGLSRTKKFELFASPHTSYDLTKKQDVKFLISWLKPDIVIQAAAVTSGSKDIVERPYLHVTDNAVMNSLILREVYEQSIPHFVFFSCSAVYPPYFIDPVKESEDYSLHGLYEKYFGVAHTKLYIEKMCEFYSRLGRTKFTVIRHSNCYGPYDKFDLERSHVFGATVAKVMQSKGTVTVWGDGTEERDLLYVDDLVRFVELAIQKQKTPFEIVNVGAGHSVSVSGLVDRIAILAEKDIAIERDLTKPTIPTKVVLDCTKAKEMFGWEPQVSLEEGIRKTLQWYKENV